MRKPSPSIACSVLDVEQSRERRMFRRRSTCVTVFLATSVLLLGSLCSTNALASKSYFHEGRFCSGNYWERVNGVSGLIGQASQAQSIDLIAPDKKGGYAIAIFSTSVASTKHEYLWIEIKKGHRRVCASFLDEGPNTPARAWIDRTSYKIWFSSGRGLTGGVYHIKFHGWPEYGDRPPSSEAPANFAPPN